MDMGMSIITYRARILEALSYGGIVSRMRSRPLAHGHSQVRAVGRVLSTAPRPARTRRDVTLLNTSVPVNAWIAKRDDGQQQSRSG